MLSKKELRLLSSSRGIEYLLMAKNPDFKGVASQLLYERKLVKLQAELIKAQNWVVENEERVVIIVEGREFAGKGDAIRAFTDHLNPRSMRVVALQKPTSRERGQWYFKRYIQQLPERGEIAFFDRSWYNRAIVEPVNGFCTQDEYERFMNEVNHFEEMLIGDGIRLMKFYLSISKEEQKKRIQAVRKDPLRRWELTPVDLAAMNLWDEYTHYKKQMFKRTDGKANPWIRIKADDRRQAHLEGIRRILKQLPYK
ncbi:MAG: polyphosphate kinase 2 [Phaeodactylibacter sp.]|nr:polyphosphate kinase 2 [Phaeodactylibacter sp.]MCB9265983.1 polyphosphate kinase 2 [Lewinellaceae bacterium]MCB9290227.1 polyphosphate kinase 2 [Lewinellaceae bacterium]